MMEELMLIVTNKIVISCFLAAFLAQLIKTVIDFFHKKKVGWDAFIETGGMPSAHSSTVTALSLSVFLVEGVTTLLIATLVFSLIVMRDAAGLRRQSGEQALLLNKIIKRLQMHMKFDHKLLKAVLGHSPTQVFFGILLGIIVTLGVFAL